MGGILTQMQVTNTGRVLWDTVFGKNADSVYKMFPQNSMVKQALIFKANPDISRVVFFSTPHLGSKLADLKISWIVGSLIRMPANLARNFSPQMRTILQTINPGVRSIPSSIIGLSPKNPLLKGLAKLPITVPYYSIVGNQGKDNLPLADTTDGIVPYWSSHMDGAQSELVVPTGHNSFDNPKSEEELLRFWRSKSSASGHEDQRSLCSHRPVSGGSLSCSRKSTAFFLCGIPAEFSLDSSGVQVFLS